MLAEISVSEGLARNANKDSSPALQTIIPFRSGSSWIRKRCYESCMKAALQQVSYTVNSICGILFTNFVGRIDYYGIACNNEL
jgi:hypothetical protein